MENFDIIGVLENYALSKNWKFVYGYNNFESNIQVMHSYTQDEYVLIADFSADPTYLNGKIPTITYNCLLMLGRKFDPDTTSVSLDETAKQKYDRRLKVLSQMLANAINEISCDNELEVQAAPIGVEINVFDTNIDFAVSDKAIFVQ